jgi:PhnB protein
MRMPMGDRIGHAEIQIGDAHVMLADEFPDVGIHAPAEGGTTSISVMIYVPDVDEAFARALAGGARQERPVEDQFYGDRSGVLIDPFGHRWMVATHIEDVSPEELARRMEAMAEPAQA